MIKKQCANCPPVISLTIFRSQHLCKRGFVNICDCISRVHIDPDISAGTVQPRGCQKDRLWCQVPWFLVALDSKVEQD